MQNAKNMELSSLYEQHKSKIFDIKQKCIGNMNGPFLIHPPEAYWEANLKVAFMGQETTGWNYTGTVPKQMAKHKNFALRKNHNRGPFWNVIRKFEKSLCVTAYSSSWQNLNRYDQDRKRPSKSNREILSELDFLTLKELEILHPDVVILFTGPVYDFRIKSLLGGVLVDVDGFKRRELCLIKSPLIDATIFRTYHPKYLRISGLEKKVIARITALVQNVVSPGNTAAFDCEPPKAASQGR